LLARLNLHLTYCLNWFSKVIVIGKTLRTALFIVASHKTLFGIVGDISCKDQEDTMNKAIGTNNIYPIKSCLLQRLKQ